MSPSKGGRLTELRQSGSGSGSGKVMLPRSHAAIPEVVFLNTSGGLTAEDRLDYSLRLGRLVLRCLAADAWPLRRQMVRLISRLDPGGVPRCWQM